MSTTRRDLLKGIGLASLSGVALKQKGLAEESAVCSDTKIVERPIPNKAVHSMPSPEQFLNPPRSVRPITWYWPQHPEPETISDELGELEKLGIGGVCLLPQAPGMKYLSPEFWQTVKLTVEEAVRRNYRIWLYDENGFPSGTAGGDVAAHRPEVLVTGLEYNEEPPAAGGKLIATVDGAAWVQRTGDPIEGIESEETRSSGFEHPLTNLMDANGGREFISSTYEGYARTIGSHFGKEIEAIFTDEPSLHVAGWWEFGQKAEDHRPLFPWVEGFLEYFKTRMGYDLTPHLPCLVKDCGPETVNVRCDYWEVVTQLITEGYFNQLHDWCARHNIAFTGHLLLEEWLMTHTMFTGSLMRASSREHIPGVDLIGERGNLDSLEFTMAGYRAVNVAEPGGRIVDGVGGVWVPKYISSAAHTRGRTDVMSESFAASGNTLNLEKLVGTANWESVAGVTELLPMSEHYGRIKIPENAWETTHDNFYHDPTFFATYLGRLRSMLSGGTHVADVAILVPETSIWANYVPAPVTMPFDLYRKQNPIAASIDDDFGTLSSQLLRHQIDFDYLDDEITVTAEVEGGKFRIADESYRILVIPSSTTMRCSVADKVAAFRRAGGKVIACGQLPTRSMERGMDGRLAEALSLCHRVPDAQGVIEAITAEGQRDFSLAQPDPHIYYLHRRKQGRDIYFVINMATEDRELEPAFRAKGSASVWDPRTGETRAFTEKRIKIPSTSAMFVVFG